MDPRMLLSRAMKTRNAAQNRAHKCTTFIVFIPPTISSLKNYSHKTLVIIKNQKKRHLATTETVWQSKENLPVYPPSTGTLICRKNRKNSSGQGEMDSGSGCTGPPHPCRRHCQNPPGTHPCQGSPFCRNELPLLPLRWQ